MAVTPTLKPGDAVAVAFSGGLDSTALLLATARQAVALHLRVLALHVHHGLQPEADAWVAQASTTWSRAQLERAAEEICAEVTPVLCAHLETAGTVLHAASHRWRYARTEQGVDSPCLWSAAQGVGACGDFAMAFPQAASDVERAWLSGVAMAGRILGG